MVSEIQNTNLSLPSPLPAVAQPVPATPSVVAPKRVEVQYDEGKARKSLQEAVSYLNEQIASTKTGLGFRIDDSLKIPVVTVHNTQTGEFVRQIPSEQAVAMAHSIDDMKGLLLNAKI